MITSFLELLRDDASSRERNESRYGPIHSYILGKPCVSVSGADLSRAVLRDSDTFLNRTVFPGFAEMLGEDVNSFTDGATHVAERARVTRALPVSLRDVLRAGFGAHAGFLGAAGGKV